MRNRPDVEVPDGKCGLFRAEIDEVTHNFWDFACIEVGPNKRSRRSQDMSILPERHTKMGEDLATESKFALRSDI